MNLCWDVDLTTVDRDKKSEIKFSRDKYKLKEMKFQMIGPQMPQIL